MSDPTTKTICCVCEGGIFAIVTCFGCKRHACYICTDPNSRCASCRNGGLPVSRQGINKGKWVGTSELDPLPDAPCDSCKKEVPANELAYCNGPRCTTRWCGDCLMNDDVRCPVCPPVEVD